MITVRCPGCSAHITVWSRRTGADRSCLRCGGVFRHPDLLRVTSDRPDIEDDRDDNPFRNMSPTNRPIIRPNDSNQPDRRVDLYPIGLALLAVATGFLPGLNLFGALPLTLSVTGAIIAVHSLIDSSFSRRTNPWSIALAALALVIDLAVMAMYGLILLQWIVRP